jgi:EAL domain-containing protein (putative c-di-GMP-specific phosphodiesterase class I)
MIRAASREIPSRFAGIAAGLYIRNFLGVSPRGETRRQVQPDPPSNELSGAESSARWSAAAPRSVTQNALAELVAPADLFVVFQPIVDLAKGTIFAHETLVRCRVPALANPLRLFDRAVADGCSGRLGRMIREIAVPLCSGIPLFVNVHPSELTAQWLVRPDDPIFSHDHDVYIEITEAVSFSHFRLCMDVLREVRSRERVHLVVDDLGAGFSNLKRIADLEPRVVKLDIELIRDIHLSRRQQLLVRAVVRLCEDLGASVVAEGIEKVEERDALLDTGAHYGQGYLFAKPAFPIPSIVWPPLPPGRQTSAPPSRRM